MQLFFVVHPVTLLAILASGLARAAPPPLRRWPGWPIACVWAVAPPALNPLIWLAGAPLFGWHMGGLGGWLYLWLFLPLNGLAIGIASITPLSARLRRWSGWRLLCAGLGVQTTVLFLWLAVASQLHMYAGNVSP